MLRAVRRLLLLGCALLGVLAAAAPVAAAEPFMWSAPTHIDGAGLNAVSCPSVSLCVVGDTAGNVLTATNPYGGAWTAAHLGATSVTGLSCTTNSSLLCVAIESGGQLLKATSPTGGAGAWSSPSTPPALSSQDAVSCASTALCVAVDLHGNIGAANQLPNGPWRTDALTGSPDLRAISCVVGWLCVATDTSGEVFSSANPEQGAAHWLGATSPASVDPGHAINGVSCPTTQRCVAVDDSGNVLTSTDPLDGSTTWSTLNVDGTTALNGISCQSGLQTVCVAVDSRGNVMTSTDPGTSWSAPQNIDGTNALTGVSCSNGLMCAVTDSVGNVIVGMPSAPPTNISPPSISGTVVEGDRLLEANGLWTGDPYAYRYQWEDCGRAGASCSAISGATAKYYRLGSSDAAHTIRVEEWAINAAGASAPAASSPTIAVPAPPARVSSPRVWGQVIAGRYLHGSVGQWWGDSPISYAYQWQSCRRSCTNIVGATASNYRLRSGDRGAQIRVLVTATNSAGRATALSLLSTPVLTPQQIRALIRKAIAPRGRHPRLAPIAHLGFVVVFKAPMAGRLKVVWKLGHTVIARATMILGRNSRGQMRLRLRGNQALQSGLKVTAYGTFIPTGGGGIGARTRSHLY